MKLEDRSRFEYRVREGKENTWRYRQKLTVSFPARWTHSGMRPYISDEVFLDLDTGDFNRNRLYVGMKCSLTNNLKADVFYLWQRSKKHGDWTGSNILGAKLKLAF